MTKGLLELKMIGTKEAEGIIALKKLNFMDTGLCDEEGNKFVYNVTDYMSKAINWIDRVILQNKLTHNSSWIKGVISAEASFSSAIDGGDPNTYKGFADSTSFKMYSNLIDAILYARKTKITQRNVRTLWCKVIGDLKDNPAADGELYRSADIQIDGHWSMHYASVPNAMSMYFKNAKSRTTITDCIARHYFFEYVHPFCCGNGRTGRVLFWEDLIRSVSPIFNMFFCSDVLFEYRGQYFHTFALGRQAIDGFHDITPFMEFMLYAIASSLRLPKSAEVFKDSALDYCLRKLNNASVVSRKDLIDNALYSSQTISAVLRKLESEKKILKTVVDGKTYYSFDLSPIL